MTRIIIDSTIDLPEQYRRQVHIVPLTIHFGTEELLDGVDIDRQRFYERLVRIFFPTKIPLIFSSNSISKKRISIGASA